MKERKRTEVMLNSAEHYIPSNQLNSRARPTAASVRANIIQRMVPCPFVAAVFRTTSSNDTPLHNCGGPKEVMNMLDVR